MYEWLFPIIIGIIVFISLFNDVSNSTITEFFKNNSINLLGILVGFSITIITILITGHSKSLEEIKKKLSNTRISNKKISLYRLLLINFIYSVVIEAFLIIALLLYPLIIKNFTIPRILKLVLFSMMVCAILHILLLTIRNLTDFYLILIKNEK